MTKPANCSSCSRKEQRSVVVFALIILMSGGDLPDEDVTVDMIRKSHPKFALKSHEHLRDPESTAAQPKLAEAVAAAPVIPSPSTTGHTTKKTKTKAPPAESPETTQATIASSSKQTESAKSSFEDGATAPARHNATKATQASAKSCKDRSKTPTSTKNACEQEDLKCKLYQLVSTSTLKPINSWICIDNESSNGVMSNDAVTKDTLERQNITLPKNQMLQNDPRIFEGLKCQRRSSTKDQSDSKPPCETADNRCKLYQFEKSDTGAPSYSLCIENPQRPNAPIPDSEVTQSLLQQQGIQIRKGHQLQSIKSDQQVQKPKPECKARKMSNEPQQGPNGKKTCETEDHRCKLYRFHDIVKDKPGSFICIENPRYPRRPPPDSFISAYTMKAQGVEIPEGMSLQSKPQDDDILGRLDVLKQNVTDYARQQQDAAPKLEDIKNQAKNFAYKYGVVNPPCAHYKDKDECEETKPRCTWNAQQGCISQQEHFTGGQMPLAITAAGLADETPEARNQLLARLASVQQSTKESRAIAMLLARTTLQTGHELTVGHITQQLTDLKNATKPSIRRRLLNALGMNTVPESESMLRNVLIQGTELLRYIMVQTDPLVSKVVDPLLSASILGSLGFEQQKASSPQTYDVLERSKVLEIANDPIYYTHLETHCLFIRASQPCDNHWITGLKQQLMDLEEEHDPLFTLLTYKVPAILRENTSPHYDSDLDTVCYSVSDLLHFLVFNLNLTLPEGEGLLALSLHSKKLEEHMKKKRVVNPTKSLRHCCGITKEKHVHFSRFEKDTLDSYDIRNFLHAVIAFYLLQMWMIMCKDDSASELTELDKCKELVETFLTTQKHDIKQLAEMCLYPRGDRDTAIAIMLLVYGRNGACKAAQEVYKNKSVLKQTLRDLEMNVRESLQPTDAASTFRKAMLFLGEMGSAGSAFSQKLRQLNTVARQAVRRGGDIFKRGVDYFFQTQMYVQIALALMSGLFCTMITFWDGAKYLLRTERFVEVGQNVKRILNDIYGKESTTLQFMNTLMGRATTQFFYTLCNLGGLIAALPDAWAKLRFDLSTVYAAIKSAITLAVPGSAQMLSMFTSLYSSFALGVWRMQLWNALLSKVYNTMHWAAQFATSNKGILSFLQTSATGTAESSIEDNNIQNLMKTALGVVSYGATLAYATFGGLVTVNAAVLESFGRLFLHASSHLHRFTGCQSWLAGSSIWLIRVLGSPCEQVKEFVKLVCRVIPDKRSKHLENLCARWERRLHSLCMLLQYGARIKYIYECLWHLFGFVRTIVVSPGGGRLLALQWENWLLLTCAGSGPQVLKENEEGTSVNNALGTENAAGSNKEKTYDRAAQYENARNKEEAAKNKLAEVQNRLKEYEADNPGLFQASKRFLDYDEYMKLKFEQNQYINEAQYLEPPTT